MALAGALGLMAGACLAYVGPLYALAAICTLALCVAATSRLPMASAFVAFGPPPFVLREGKEERK